MPNYSCPRCKTGLSEVESAGVVVDVCKAGCGGIWFDDKELKKFDEESEDARPIIFDAAQYVSASSAKDRGPALGCPKCKGDSILARRAAGPDAKITIDQCLTCSGIWLDAGELEAYRGQFKTEAERQKAADDYLRPHLQSMLGEVQHEIDRTKALSEEYRRADTFGKKFSLCVRDLLGRD